jgi:undecaprenyl diphosphate synthase
MKKLNHVAIIMDGNGRWGLKKGRSRNYGHLRGIKTVESLIKISAKLKIPYLTLYTFSTENWKRPESEINFLFNLIRKSLKTKLKIIIKQGIKINIIGKKARLPKDIKVTIKNIEKRTRNNKTITINLALNYGSKEEIVNACKAISKDKKNEINVKNFTKKLYTNGIPDPEVLIRTGGTKRLSNFLLWQLAYTEIFFVNKMWPEFNDNDFINIIKKFYKIKRNFGNI